MEKPVESHHEQPLAYHVEEDEHRSFVSKVVHNLPRSVSVRLSNQNRPKCGHTPPALTYSLVSLFGALSQTSQQSVFLRTFTLW